MIKNIFRLFLTLLGGSVLLVTTALIVYYVSVATAKSLRYVLVEWVPFINTFPEWGSVIIGFTLILFIVATIVVYFDARRTKGF